MTDDDIPRKPRSRTKECEELQAAKNPSKWMTAMNFFQERSLKSNNNLWAAKNSTPFEPVKEIAYRENIYQDLCDIKESYEDPNAAIAKPTRRNQKKKKLKNYSRKNKVVKY